MAIKKKHLLVDRIGSTPLGKGLSKKHIDLMAGCAKNIRFDSGRFLLRADQPAEHFYLLTRGSASIEVFVPHQGAKRLQTAGMNEIVGFSCFIPPYRSRFDVRALETITAFEFDAHCLRGKCDRDPALGYALFARFSAIMARRLEAARIQLLDVYGGSADAA